MAEKLLEAERIVRQVSKELPRIPGHFHRVEGLLGPVYREHTDNPKCEYYAQSIERAALIDECMKRIFALLGWTHAMGEDEFLSPNFYRAAALACLKLIKRI